MARRSKRLSSRGSTTPKRVSLSHDAPTRTPKTAPVKMSTLTENDEMPGAFPTSASPPETTTPSAAPSQGVKVPVHFNDTTPKRSTPPKPSSDEMHPAHHHQSTAKPLEEARWLGFANMAPPNTEPAKQKSKIATLQDTPTRAAEARSGIKGPQYQFTFQREHSLELSPDAKRLMFEKREEANRIREQMMAAGEGREAVEAAVARKIATPKGKTGRFSQAHQETFQKMDPIAGHASAFRADPAWKKPSPAQQESHDKTPQSTAKSLKRSPSKAQLDEPERAKGPALTRSPSKPTLSAGSGLPRAASVKNLHQQDQSSSPAKRVKRFQGDDATITRPTSSGSDSRQPGTPSPVKHQPSYPDLASLASPTQASLARAGSVKSTKTSKIPAPHLTRSPSKPDLISNKDGPSTPLLSRSPSKGGLFDRIQEGGAQVEKPKLMSPLLTRSPAKGSLFGKKDGAKDGVEGNEEKTKQAPLFSRSPMKMSVAKSAGASNISEVKETSSSKESLLHRSPMKISIANHDANAGADKHDAPKNAGGPSSLASRSPMKMSVTKLPDFTANQETGASAMPPSPSPTKITKQPAADKQMPQKETPTKPSNKSLMDRFSFLRTSPMKSILRSPQRLYSDDPAKVASGTHLATPPKKTAREMNKRLSMVSQTVPSRKHVDFSSSTKARYERGISEVPSTPTKESSQEPQNGSQPENPSQAPIAQYPSLPTESEVAITPQKRRQTIAPGDFTFRAGPEGIVFSTSPNAPPGMASKKRPSTIRHVSAEPTLPPASTTKKRKFEFENQVAAREDTNPVATTVATSKKRKFEFENEKVAETEAAAEDKENAAAAAGEEDESEGRPAKRMKQSAPTPEKKSRRPALGVKPKNEVKGGRSASGSMKPAAGKGAKGAATAGAGNEGGKPAASISQARLAALAQPKKRG